MQTPEPETSPLADALALMFVLFMVAWAYADVIDAILL